jgi:hypothetical protein
MNVYVSEPFSCKDCGGELYVTDDLRSKSGKRIPINTANDEPHRCPNRRNSSFACRRCGTMLYLDDSRLSKSGKRIPLETSDGRSHQCPERAKALFGLKTMFG